MLQTRTVKRLLHLAIGLLLWSVIVSAQTTGGAITGTIQDANGALEGASVFLVKDRETQEIVLFAVSDAKGHFTMNAPAGNYTFDNSYDDPTLYLSISYKFSNGKDTSSTRSQGARDIERRF